jgi:hypothetical protein
MKITESKFLQKLTARKLSAVEALLDSPAADQALAAAEAKVLARRRELLDELERVDAPHQKPRLEATKKLEAAVTRRVAAQAELQASLMAEAGAMQTSYGAAHTAYVARAEIVGALVETSDPRVSRFAAVLSSLDDSVRAGLTFYPRKERSNGEVGFRVAYSTNMAEVKTARAAIAECAAECGDLVHASLGYDATTACFIGLCEKLEGPLAEMELNPPQIGQGGEVEAALPWGRGQRWRVEAAQSLPRQQPPIENPPKSARH